MSQKLLMPFKNSMIICGYKTAQYRKSWGYEHYGIDISTWQGIIQPDHYIRASGEGTVVAVGDDGSLGKGIAIVYKDCESRTGEIKSLTARYMHMAKIYVKQGQKVKAGEIIADEGKEGTTSYHLHFELDTDITWATYTPQVSKYNHNFWHKGKDTTVNPSLWLWQSNIAVTTPYNFSNKAWINLGIDDNIPKIENNNELETLKKENESLKKENESLKQENKKLKEIISQIIKIANNYEV